MLLAELVNYSLPEDFLYVLFLFIISLLFVYMISIAKKCVSMKLQRNYCFALIFGWRLVAVQLPNLGQ